MVQPNFLVYLKLGVTKKQLEDGYAYKNGLLVGKMDQVIKILHQDHDIIMITGTRREAPQQNQNENSKSLKENQQRTDCLRWQQLQLLLVRREMTNMEMEGG